MKYKVLILLTLIFLSVPTIALAADETTRKRPDQAEFVTESHVRLTTESLTVAEVTEATPAPKSTTSFWDYISQSLSAFLQSLRDIFVSRN